MQLKKTISLAAVAAITCGAVAYAAGFSLSAPPKIAFLYFADKTDVFREVVRELVGVDLAVSTAVAGGPTEPVAAQPEIDLTIVEDSEPDVVANEDPLSLLQRNLGARVVDDPEPDAG